MDFLVMRVFVKIWWIFPFTFVFSLLFAIRETVKDGPNDLKYALAAAATVRPATAAAKTRSTKSRNA